MAKVEIYTKTYCPYCTRAMALLKHKAVDFQELKIDGDMALREVMIERGQGSYTVPQIFINDIHVGGCDELMALEMNHQLDALLAI
jgi:glutaredoxin 3